ncbi:ABC transporter ATP-binding protein/permease [Lolliginicoccus levis]|uniref:ABC transporter ATP-binding protein/permease n=1 Tax=Lolliginicoccus levis TaxID=2919542 RepID=UPI00241DDFB4|nr:ABC transporter ATP-binding protein/permease [Lolliginicoccus levis]
MVGASGIDWGQELVTSIIWILRAFAISSVAFGIAAFLLARYTRWGRQFWRITGPYFSGREARRTLPFVALLLLMMVFGVRMAVLFSYQGNDLYTALQNAGSALAGGDQAGLDAAIEAFWDSIIVFGVLATIHVVRVLLNFYIGQAFDIRWRLWLNKHTIDHWLEGGAYYRNRFVDRTIDNPDQRIQQDITALVQTSRSLAIGAIGSMVTVVSFTMILWDLSGPLTILGVTIPRAMMFLVLGYVLVTTVVAFWIGRPLIRLNFINERLSANFRYSLVRLRDTAENVAFYRGEGVERRGLLARFAAVIRNYWDIVFRTLKFDGWNLTVNQTAVIFPIVIQAPRFFSGQITLGDLTQTARAFGEIHDSLSFFREAYDIFADYRASLIRLDGLRMANDRSRELPRLAASATGSVLAVRGVSVSTPDGRTLIEGLDLDLEPGDALVIKGPSGAGKTTLLRALARIWPFATGEVRRPEGEQTLFLSQVPYLPLGDLRSAVAYPADPGGIDDERIRAVLRAVHLGHLAERIEDEADWSAVLSPGEQQRLGFARVLLIRPAVVFLDESTSAIDEGLEFSLYELVRSEVPETIVVSVAHRSTVDQHHTHRLVLDGEGGWQVDRMVAAPQ